MTAFDPERPDYDMLEKDPAQLTPEERAVAAQHALYEAVRHSVALRTAAEYLAELAGVADQEIRITADRAEADEFALEDGEPEYDVAESYEDAAKKAGAETQSDDPSAWGEK